ncbi:hypothetical protein T281_09300 [Rhodomicrobium udaipurense JA643]|nr:hypothetical protein T281_09300 [Rhodomicrobium udaipurense JA643]
MAAPHPATQELRKIAGERFFRVFDDWLELALAAYAREEDRYMEVIRRYGPREAGKEHPADHFAHALGAIQLEMHKDNETGELRDNLGEIYEAEGGNERAMSQYFSPMPLCRMMASMLIDDTTPERASIADPACGSGRMLMACIPLRPKGYFFGVDLDRTCAKMAALNMLWRNVDSTIIWGDTLRLKGRGGWAIASTILGGQLRWLAEPEAQKLLEDSVRKMQPQPGPEPAPVIVPAREGKRGQFEMDI